MFRENRLNCGVDTGPPEMIVCRVSRAFPCRGNEWTVVVGKFSDRRTASSKLNSPRTHAHHDARRVSVSRWLALLYYRHNNNNNMLKWALCSRNAFFKCHARRPRNRQRNGWTFWRKISRNVNGDNNFASPYVVHHIVPFRQKRTPAEHACAESWPSRWRLSPSTVNN